MSGKLQSTDFAATEGNELARLAAHNCKKLMMII